MSQDNSPDQPFSTLLLSLIDEYHGADDEDIRLTAMLKVAQQFSTETDTTDVDVFEVLADAVDEYRATALAHRQASLRLARIGIDFVYNVLTDPGEDEPAPKGPSRGDLN